LYINFGGIEIIAEFRECEKGSEQTDWSDRNDEGWNESRASKLTDTTGIKGTIVSAIRQ
jgi:hypothetical protein